MTLRTFASISHVAQKGFAVLHLVSVMTTKNHIFPRCLISFNYRSRFRLRWSQFKKTFASLIYKCIYYNFQKQRLPFVPTSKKVDM